MLFSSEKIEKCVNRYLHNIPEGEGGWKEILVLDPVATQQLCNPGHLGKLLQGVLKLAKHHAGIGTKHALRKRHLLLVIPATPLQMIQLALPGKRRGVGKHRP